MFGDESRSNWWRDHRIDVVCLAVVIAGIGLSLCFQPARTADHLLFFGEPVPSTCTMKSTFGVPCWSCGMTRSFAYGVRFRLVESWGFNPAGTLLLGYLVLHGLYRCWTITGGRRIGFGLQVSVLLLVVAFMFGRWFFLTFMPLFTS